MNKHIITHTFVFCVEMAIIRLQAACSFKKYEIHLQAVYFIKMLTTGMPLYHVETIFKKYNAALCYYASHYITDREVVSDLVQDIFVRLIEVPQQFDSPEHLRNYLYLSVRNACLNHLQRNILKERHERYVIENEDTSGIPDEEILTAEVYRQLKEAVDELPGECRKILYMSYFEGEKNEVIAARLHISVNTVRAQKMRGKKLLKEKLKNLLPLLLLFPDFFN